MSRRNRLLLGVGVFVLVLLLTIPFRIPGRPLAGFWKTTHEGIKYCEGHVAYASFLNGHFSYDTVGSSACSGHDGNGLSYQVAPTAVPDTRFSLELWDDSVDPPVHKLSVSLTFLSPNTLMIDRYPFKRLSLVQAFLSLFLRARW